MRLTLRTLLAYLDDILDPADKEELAQKIESSDFAEDLVHRTRDTMRRLRLSAPQPIGVGMGLDPNTVAEYLDNVLPPEQVGDYERICLESDVHLAEAAACHHVLTMVLGEPANVEPRARHRMYNIPAEARDRKRIRVEPAHARPAAIAAEGVAKTQARVQSVAPVAAAVARPEAVEIPEYLRARSWWRSPVAVGALALLLFAAVAWFALSGLQGWGGAGADDVAVSGERDDAKPQAEDVTEPVVEVPPVVIEEDVVVAEAPVESPAADASVATVTNETTSAPALAPPPQLTPPALGGSATTTVVEEPPVEETPTPPVAEATSPVVVPPQLENVPAETATANVTSEGFLPPATDTQPVVPANELAASTNTLPTTSDEDATRIAAATPTTSADAVPGVTEDMSDGGAVTEEVPAGPAEIGTYLSGKTVLLRYDEPAGAWFRMEPRSAVVEGQVILALPEFRPTISLASGMHFDISGGTMVRMLSGAEAGSGAPVIEVLYGRIIVTNTSNAENQIQLKVGDQLGVAQLDRNATLAVEVERPYVAGNDPRKMAAPVVVRMFAPNGGVTWQDAAGEVVADKASRWTLAAGAAAQVAGDPSPPDWIDQEPTEHLSEQRFGAPVIESTLMSDKPADIQLLELFKGSARKEVKSLATRSAIHVGLFAPFVDALRDSQLKWPTWRTHIETLRTAMAYSPASAESVFQALNEQRGRTAAADLYEMLCGYSDEQIGTTPEDTKAGALVRLIDWLEDDSLDYRVLAVYNLWEITGKQLMPNPAASVTVRKQNVRRWRDRLDAGELVPVRE